jgi:hypothetical protein
MMRIIAFGLLTALAACGAGGEPIKPTLNAGVSVGTVGVNSNVSVGARKGPFSVNWGLF